MEKLTAAQLIRVDLAMLARRMEKVNKDLTWVKGAVMVIYAILKEHSGLDANIGDAIDSLAKKEDKGDPSKGGN